MALFHTFRVEKIILLLIYIYPISIVVGPAVAETIIILSCLFFFRLLKDNIHLLFHIKIFKFFIFFYFYLLICSIFGYDPIFSLKTTFPYIRHIIFVFLIYLLLVQQKIKQNILFFVLLYLISFLIIDLFIQFNFGKNIFGFEKVGHFRYGGMFNDELVLGSYLTKIFPIFLALFCTKKYKNRNYFCLFFLILLVSSTLLTGERTSFFLSVLLFFILFSFIKINSFHKFLILIFILLSGIIFLNINNNKIVKDRMFNSSFQSMFKNEKITVFTENHEKLYKASIKMFIDSPLIGHGPKSFRKICKLEKFYVNKQEACQTHPHNIYLQLLAETGLLGLIFLILLFIYLIKSIVKYQVLSKNQNNEKIIFFILIVGLFMNLFPFAPTGNFFNNWYSMVIYYVLPYLIFFKTKYNFNN